MSWAARVRQLGQEAMLKQSVKQSALLLGLAVTLTCGIGAAMSLTAPAPILVQSDTSYLGAGEHEIYYTHPYKVPPHLNISGGKAIQQGPDRFTVMIQPKPPPEPPEPRLPGYIPSLAELSVTSLGMKWWAQGVPLTDPRPVWETMPGWGWICLGGMVLGACVILWSFLQLGALGSATTTSQGAWSDSNRQG
jgi:hypothetical protein